MSLQLISGLAVSGLINTTVYRVTPKNYSGILTNMNSGDINGDCTFGLMELTFPYWCPENPNWLNCQNVPILNIPGFNVYEEHVIEQDERFGEYSLCNPNPDTAVFACETHDQSCWYEHSQWADFTPNCSKFECHCPAVSNASVGREFCPLCDIPLTLIPDCPKQCSPYITGVNVTASPLTPAVKVLRDVELADCCSATDETLSAEDIRGWAYDNNTRTCQIFGGEFKQVPSTGSYTGVLWKGGLNGTAQYYLGSTRAASKTLNGTWYSTVENGECREGQQVGVDCWWRKVETKRTVNATCVAQNIVKGVYEKRPGCWVQSCPQGFKWTDECSVRCVFETILGTTNSTDGPMPREEICRGFHLSFESSDVTKLGCPDDPVF